VKRDRESERKREGGTKTMTLVRWDPFQELASWSNRLNRSINEGAPRTLRRVGPAVDIFEKDHNLVIRAELPGVKQGRHRDRHRERRAVAQGERKRESEVEEGSAYRLERVYGAFTRSFSLPTTVDPSKVQAVYKDGVLEVTVPKLEAAKPKKVQIQAAKRLKRNSRARWPRAPGALSIWTQSSERTRTEMASTESVHVPAELGVLPLRNSVLFRTRSCRSPSGGGRP
jgi:HSP20 family protein